MFNRLRKIFAPVDKVFLVGFTLLTAASFVLGGASVTWLGSTALGVVYIAWRIRNGLGR